MPRKSQRIPSRRPAAPIPKEKEAPRSVQPKVTAPEEWRVKAGSKAGQDWLEKQEKHMGHQFGLRSPFTRDSQVPLQRRGLDFASLAQPATPESPATMVIDGDVWEVGIFGPDVFPSVAMRLQKKPDTIAQIPDEARIDPVSLATFAKKAKESKQLEERDDAGMSKGFDISDGEPIAYMDIADLSDNLTRNIATDSAPFGDVLAERYTVYRGPGSSVDASMTDPMTAIARYIDVMFAKGIRNFYFNFYAHGSQDAMHFGDRVLRMREMQNVFLHFPTCRFTINTVSCFGGGITDSMRGFRDRDDARKGRIAAFTQTKGNVPNFGDVNVDFDKANNLQKDYSTLYNAALAHYLMQGVNGRPGEKLTYGQAHLLADRVAKAKFTDAEVTTSQPGAPSNYTAGVEKETNEWSV